MGLSKASLCSFLLPALLLVSSSVHAAPPSPSTSVGDLPTSSFAGEQFCFDAPLANTGDTGFGPYLQLQLPPEITFDAGDTNFLGAPVDSQDLGVFPTPPSFSINYKRS